MANKKYLNDDFYNNYLIEYYKSKNNNILSDEAILEKIDIKTIENFLRKKKMQNINK